MLLSDVENVDYMRWRLYKGRYNLLNVHKSGGRINIPPTPKNASGGLVTIVEQPDRGEKREKPKKDNEYQNVYSEKYSLGLLTIPQFIYR